LGASVCKAKKRARLVMAGVYNNNEAFALGHYLQNRAPMLVAAYPNQSPNMMDDLQRGMWALDHGWLPMADLVTHRFPLEDVSRAIELARTKADGYIKGIIVPDESLL
jgi:threonine dehydrogenase-like Zn-dependent dehydrogenase